MSASISLNICLSSNQHMGHGQCTRQLTRCHEIISARRGKCNLDNLILTLQDTLYYIHLAIMRSASWVGVVPSCRISKALYVLSFRFFSNKHSHLSRSSTICVRVLGWDVFVALNKKNIQGFTKTQAVSLWPTRSAKRGGVEI